MPIIEHLLLLFSTRFIRGAEANINWANKRRLDVRKDQKFRTNTRLLLQCSNNISLLSTAAFGFDLNLSSIGTLLARCKLNAHKRSMRHWPLGLPHISLLPWALRFSVLSAMLCVRYAPDDCSGANFRSRQIVGQIMHPYFEQSPVQIVKPIYTRPPLPSHVT